MIMDQYQINPGLAEYEDEVRAKIEMHVDSDVYQRCIRMDFATEVAAETWVEENR